VKQRRNHAGERQENPILGTNYCTQSSFFDAFDVENRKTRSAIFVTACQSDRLGPAVNLQLAKEILKY
jgi:hypothetical protein